MDREDAASRGPACPRIIVGGIQSGVQDAMPTPAVILSYPDEGSALQAAKILLALQNGTKPFATGPDVYVGDTNIKVEFLTRASGKPSAAVCAVWAKADRRHLSCSFYAASQIDLEMVKLFRDLLEMNRSFAINVACGDRVLPDALDVVKYSVEERRIRDKSGTGRHP